MEVEQKTLQGLFTVCITAPHAGQPCGRGADRDEVQRSSPIHTLCMIVRRLYGVGVFLNILDSNPHNMYATRATLPTALDDIALILLLQRSEGLLVHSESVVELASD
jgi:hypothetical protein